MGCGKKNLDIYACASRNAAYAESAQPETEAPSDGDSSFVPTCEPVGLAGDRARRNQETQPTGQDDVTPDHSEPPPGIAWRGLHLFRARAGAFGSEGSERSAAWSR